VGSGGTLLEVVGVDGGGFGEGGGAQCHRGCRWRDSASRRIEASGDRSTDQRRGPVTRRSRPPRLTRRDADEWRDCGGTLAAQSEGEKRREGVARSAWRCFLSSRSAGAGLPNGWVDKPKNIQPSKPFHANPTGCMCSLVTILQ